MHASAMVVWFALAMVVAVWLATRGGPRVDTASGTARSGTTAAVFRAGLVGDWRAADCRGRLPFAAARVSRGGGMGHRARHRARRGVVGPAGRRRGVERSPTSAALVLLFYLVPLYRSVRRLARDGRRLAHRRARRQGRRAVGASGQPDRRRCAGTELGVGAAVLRAPALPADGPARARLHHLAARAQLLHRALVRRDAPGDSRLVVGRRSRFRSRPAVGSSTRERCPERPSLDSPQLTGLIRALVDMPADDLDRNLRRMLDILPVSGNQEATKITGSTRRNGAERRRTKRTGESQPHGLLAHARRAVG